MEIQNINTKLPSLFSIEGNIGSGKSTLLENLKDYFIKNGKTLNNKHIYFIQEPVNIWETITDSNGENIISCFYKNQKKYAFSFQMMAYISRLVILKKIIKEGYDIIISERCLNTDKMVFAKMLYDDNKIEEIEYKIYNLWFNEFINDLPEFNYIYINTNPITAFERVVKRNRIGENISLKYLIHCDEYHNKWLNTQSSSNILYLDGNIDIDINTEGNILKYWISQILNFIKEEDNNFVFSIEI